MAKVLIVSDYAELEKLRLEALGHGVTVVGNFDHVRPYLTSNPDAKVVVWEGLVGNKLLDEGGYLFEIQCVFPNVINVGVYESSYFSKILEEAGCNEIVSKFAFEEKMRALLQ